MDEIIHVVQHSFEDIVTVVPLLFVVFLILEYIEHSFSKKTIKIVKNSQKTGPLWGAVLGAFPQCGFSVFVTNLFVSKVATMGTLIAVYLSTSDEMLPILLSSGVDWKICLFIVLVKILIGLCVGLTVDFFVKEKSFSQGQISELCNEAKCNCNHVSPFYSAIVHTLKVVILLFLTTVVLNSVIEFVGQDVLKTAITSLGVFGIIISAVIGFIPNCASSIVITQLFLEQAIPFGTMLAGLLSGAGLGWIVLLKYNKNKIQTLWIVVIVFICAVLAGIIGNLVTIII